MRCCVELGTELVVGGCDRGLSFGESRVVYVLFGDGG